MKEYTFTMNAQITFIVNGNFDEEKVLEAARPESLEVVLKDAIDADDVNVRNSKVFIRDEDEKNPSLTSTELEVSAHE